MKSYIVWSEFLISYIEVTWLTEYFRDIEVKCLRTGRVFAIDQLCLYDRTTVLMRSV